MFYSKTVWVNGKTSVVSYISDPLYGIHVFVLGDEDNEESLHYNNAVTQVIRDWISFHVDPAKSIELIKEIPTSLTNVSPVVIWLDANPAANAALVATISKNRTRVIQLASIGALELWMAQNPQFSSYPETKLRFITSKSLCYDSKAPTAVIGMMRSFHSSAPIIIFCMQIEESLHQPDKKQFITNRESELLELVNMK